MNLKIKGLGILALIASSNFASLALASVEKLNYGNPHFTQPKFIQMEEQNWRATGEGNGIKTFTRETEGDPLIGLRGQGVIDAPIAKVAQVIFDNSRATEWVDSLADTHIVKKVSDYEQIEYAHVSTPPIILKDRDFVTRASVHYNPDKKYIHVVLEPGDDSLVPPSNYIRGKLRGGFLLTPIENGQKTYLITEMHGDPKGDVPKWIVNMFQAGWAKNTIERIREQVKKPGILPHPKVVEVMEKGETIL